MRFILSKFFATAQPRKWCLKFFRGKSTFPVVAGHVATFSDLSN
jgi:hypothetical protein